MTSLVWFLIGLLVGVLVATVAARSIVRRRLVRQRAAERRAQAAEHMAEIGAMTGGLAHEIKNPLSTIGLNVQLLSEALQDLEIPAEDRSRLTNRAAALRREVERLRGILTDFLEYAGQVRVDAAPVDVNRLVGELIDFFMPEAERRQVRLRADLFEGPLQVNADARLVKQALLNLMLNGTQAMADAAAGQGIHGDLIVRTEGPAAKPVEHGEAASGPVMRIHVIDTGPGISPEALKKVFDPYYTTKPGGSGLGLPTARRLIEAHGGRIDVHSEVGRGTDMTIVLPVEPMVPTPTPR